MDMWCYVERLQGNKGAKTPRIQKQITYSHYTIWLSTLHCDRVWEGKLDIAVGLLYIPNDREVVSL